MPQSPGRYNLKTIGRTTAAEHRPNSNARGYTRRWGKVRAAWLADHPLCAECERQGRLTPATVVDHIKPHRGDPVLFWDETNYESKCAACHNAKTARGE